MDLIFVTEARFVRGSDGRIYSLGSYTARLWERYLEHFDHVIVFARITQDSTRVLEEGHVSETRNVLFVALPYYVGGLGFLQMKRKIYKIMDSSFQKGDAYILRVPGALGALASSVLHRKSIPYAVEVVGDPWDVYSSRSSLKHPFKPLLRVYGRVILQKMVKKASAATYVTRYYLQKRYPVTQGVYGTYASDVILKDDQIVRTGKPFDPASSVHILSIGMLSQLYKSPDVVVKAIKLLNEVGVDCRLTWLGDGIYRKAMIRYADKLEIGDKVSFVGNIPAGEAVRQYLESADLFVLASQTEGLPRALVEAMAAGLPCIATHVGGIPELLDEDWLIPVGDVLALAKKIKWAVRAPENMEQQVRKNLHKVKEYAESVLTGKRADFYSYIKMISNV